MQRAVRLLLAGVGHDNQKFVAALTKNQVASAKYLFQHSGKLGQNPVPLHASELRIYLAKIFQIHDQQSQWLAVSIGSRELMRNEFVQRAAIEQLSKRIDQGKAFEPLIKDQFANQRLACGVQSYALRQQINIKQHHQADEAEHQLRQVCLLDMNYPLRPHQVRSD